MIVKNDNIENVSNDNLSDMTQMMSEMSSMMSKLQNLDKNLNNQDDETTEIALKEMLAGVTKITQSVQAPLKQMAKDITNTPGISDAEKKTYLGLTDTMGKLTSALNTVDSDPDQAEKMLNEMMGQFDGNMKSLGLSKQGQSNSNLDSDLEERVMGLETQMSTIDKKLNALIEINKKISARLPK